ncbi:MAG: site-specific integrase [Deinococcota bacterium]
MPLKSTAKLWKQAKSPKQKYRDRLTVTLASGKKKEYAGYGPTKREATADLERKINSALQRGKTQSITVDDLFKKFLLHRKNYQGLSLSTIAHYEDNYSRYLQEALGHKAFVELSLDDLNNLLTPRLEKRHYRTAEIMVRIVNTMVRWALDQGEIKPEEMTLQLREIPKIKRPKDAETKPAPVWTVDEIGTFLIELKRIYDTSWQSAAYPFFCVALNAGLRIGEILGLPKDAVELRHIGDKPVWLLHVERQAVRIGTNTTRELGATKSVSSNRSVTISAELGTLLQEHVARVERLYTHRKDYQSNDLLFPSRRGTLIQESTIRRIKKEVIKRMGLPYIHTHQMRKIYTTYLTKELVKQGKYNPKIVAKLLGHSDTRVALAVYTQVIEADLAEATINFNVTSIAENTTKNDASEDKTEDNRILVGYSDDE